MLELLRKQDTGNSITYHIKEKTHINYFGSLCVFNFFDEIAFDFGLEVERINSFNIVNMSNKLLYVEGQKGVLSIGDDVISFRVKKGAISVFGENLKLRRITKTTLVIVGNIKKVEGV